MHFQYTLQSWGQYPRMQYDYYLAALALRALPYNCIHSYVNPCTNTLDGWFFFFCFGCVDQRFNCQYGKMTRILAYSSYVHDRRQLSMMDARLAPGCKHCMPFLTEKPALPRGDSFLLVASPPEMASQVANFSSVRSPKRRVYKPRERTPVSESKQNALRKSICDHIWENPPCREFYEILVSRIL